MDCVKAGAFGLDNFSIAEGEIVGSISSGILHYRETCES